MKKISVVTICYNCQAVIEQTIRSVIGQTYKDVEYILIDGASTDGTMAVVNRYRDKIDYISSEPDRGIYDAMNKGLRACTGDYVIFMNAGDSFYNETVLARFVPQIEPDTVIVHGDIMSIANSFKYYVKPAPLEQMAERMTVKHQATFVRADYHKLHPFDDTFRSSGDYDFFYKAHFLDSVKFQYIPLCVANFDVSGTSNVNFRRSYREDLRIWGKKDDWFFRLKLEMKFISWDIKRWIKEHLMNEQKRIEITRKRIENAGYNVYELDELVDEI